MGGMNDSAGKIINMLIPEYRFRTAADEVLSGCLGDLSFPPPSTAVDNIFLISCRAVSEPGQPILQQGKRAGNIHLKEITRVTAAAVPGKRHSPVFSRINRAISAAPPAISLQSSHRK